MESLDAQLDKYSSKFMVNPPLAEGTSLPENVLIPVIFARSAEAYKGGQVGLEKRARVTFEDASGATYYLYHNPDKPGHFLALNQDEWNAQIWKGNDALGTDREPVRIPVRDVWYPPNRESWARGPEPAPSSSKDLGIVLRGDRWVYEDTGVEFPDVEAWVHPDENYYRSRVYEDGSIPQVSLGVVDFENSQRVRFGAPAENAPVAVVREPEPVVVTPAPREAAPAAREDMLAPTPVAPPEEAAPAREEAVTAVSDQDILSAKVVLNAVSRIALFKGADGKPTRVDDIEAYRDKQDLHPALVPLVNDYIDAVLDGESVDAGESVRRMELMGSKADVSTPRPVEALPPAGLRP